MDLRQWILPFRNWTLPAKSRTLGDDLINCFDKLCVKFTDKFLQKYNINLLKISLFYLISGIIGTIIQLMHKSYIDDIIYYITFAILDCLWIFCILCSLSAVKIENKSGLNDTIGFVRFYAIIVLFYIPIILLALIVNIISIFV